MSGHARFYRGRWGARNALRLCSVIVLAGVAGTSDFGYNQVMNNKELRFAVFCIESLADYLALQGEEIYKLLTEKSDILDNYIIPCYDVLHTQGKEYIVNDIVELMREKGLII
jgi:hypothetical protein